MVANAAKNKDVANRYFQNDSLINESPSSNTPDSDSRSDRHYPGLNRLDSIKSSIQQSIIESDFWGAGGDGASELLPHSAAGNYSVFFQGATFAPDERGLVQKQFAEFLPAESPDRIRVESFESQEDLVEDLLNKFYNQSDLDCQLPVVIFEPDFQKAAQLGRMLESLGQKTHLASSFSNWANVMGQLGAGNVDVLVSTTLEIPLAEQVPWSTVYLPSTKCMGAASDPSGWVGKLVLREEETSESFEVVVGRI